MVSIERLLLFLSASMTRPQRADGFKAEWRTALRDVQSSRGPRTTIRASGTLCRAPN